MNAEDDKLTGDQFRFKCLLNQLADRELEALWISLCADKSKTRYYPAWIDDPRKTAVKNN